MKMIMKKTLKQMGMRWMKGLVGVAALAAVGVQANTIIQTWTVLPDPKTTPWTQYNDFAKFDSSLGTLTSVTINEAIDLHLSGTVWNTSDTDQNFTLQPQGFVKLGWNSSVTAPPPLILDMTKLFTKIDYSEGSGQILASGDQIYYNYTYGDHTLSQNYDTDLNRFIGSAGDLLRLTAKATTTANFVGDNLTVISTNNAAAHFSMTFNYTPVAPVPDAGSTWVLLLTGLACLPLGLCRRKG